MWLLLYIFAIAVDRERGKIFQAENWELEDP